MSHDSIKETLKAMTTVMYWCLSDETGEQGTYHTHIYFHCKSGIRFSTVQNKFYGANIQMARGTSEQNRDYVFKEGKWEKDKKAETNHRETHEEMGEVPIERQGQRNDISDLYDMIKTGYSNYDILEDSPQFMMQVDKIERVRQIVLEERYRTSRRKMEVTYVYGESGSGKTSSVMDKYKDNVYRITDYEHPFDAYMQQEVIMFDEFRSSLKIQDMLNYLDIYPLQLPCRYNNKIACYTKVYITSNIRLKEQYKNVQEEQKETWKAFIRRIHNVWIIDKSRRKEYTIEEYIKSMDYTFEQVDIKEDELPF
jgi:hypothetical protein